MTTRTKDEPQKTAKPELPLVGCNRRLTPVYSTAIPPRGLSGRLRRAAYRTPDYKLRHWALLMLADRVDALEHGTERD